MLDAVREETAREGAVDMESVLYEMDAIVGKEP
jgi:hypothetical protein